MSRYLPSFFLLLASHGATSAWGQGIVDMPLGPDLEVRQLTQHVYLHRSFMDIAPYGRVGSNGLVYCVDGECIVLDTPVTDGLSTQLLSWIRDSLRAEVKAVVATHFHIDCLGGLAALHAAGIPSYGLRLTRRLAEADGVTVPQRGFGRKKTLRLGRHSVRLLFPGEGHTIDNVVAYLPDEQVLFGGCLVKSLRSGKGNLEDANVAAWSESVRTAKEAFPMARIVVPGHGEPGLRDLLDYTIEMFR